MNPLKFLHSVIDRRIASITSSLLESMVRERLNDKVDLDQAVTSVIRDIAWAEHIDHTELAHYLDLDYAELSRYLEVDPSDLADEIRHRLELSVRIR